MTARELVAIGLVYVAACWLVGVFTTGEMIAGLAYMTAFAWLIRMDRGGTS